MSTRQDKSSASAAKATLSVSVRAQLLSDKSHAFCVVIRETGELPFVELDCISEKHAFRLMTDIRNSITRNTNITVSAF